MTSTDPASQCGWFGASELAGLPGMPGTPRGAHKMAVRIGFQRRKCERGKGFEYPLSSLPKETQDALLARMLQASEHLSAPVAGNAFPPPVFPGSAGLPAAAGLFIPAPAPGALKDWQREIASARQALLQEVARIGAASGVERAIQTLLKLAGDGALPDHLRRLIPLANAKAGKAGKRTLSRRSLYRWLHDSKRGFAALAPRDAEKLVIPPWAPALVKLYNQPQKPALTGCLDKLASALPAGVTLPSYSAARRFLEKMGTVTRERGRRLPRELKALQPFVRRDTSNLLPGDVYTADGHKFDAEVSHPGHGKAFRPEITAVLDVATRKAVGWSAGLAESTWAVNDAMRHAAESNGIPTLFYVDRGSGYANAAQADEVVGFAARVGYEITHSLPYNSQARGLMERSHHSIWVKAAKELPTYMGAVMDREAKTKVFKLTRAHIKSAGTSKLLLPWDEFLTFCQQQVDAYNARPHRSLPKVRDEVTGKLRHLSPGEMWEQAVTGGWAPMLLTDAERDDLFRPYKLCTVTRGEVRLFNNLYFSGDLAEYHGERLPVGYDIHDPSRVWVRDARGRLICVAEFEANKRDYFPQSVIERAAEKRAKAREKRLETHLQEVRDELNPPARLEHQEPNFLPTQIQADRIEVEGDAAAPGNVVPLISAEARPWFKTDPEQYRWLMQHRAQWGADDAEWLLDYVRSEDYADLAERYEYQAMGWSEEEEARAREKLERFETAAR